MKKAVLFGILVCLGLGMTALIMIPEEVKTPLILQTFSYSRAASEEPLPYRTAQETITTFLEAQDTVFVHPRGNLRKRCFLDDFQNGRRKSEGSERYL